MTIQELKAAIMEMANETKEEANTTKRIGALFDGIVEEIEKRQVALGFTPENAANKVASIAVNSTHTQYPSAKAMYEMYIALRTYMEAYFLREILPCSYASEGVIDSHNLPFNSWSEIELGGVSQYKMLRLFADFDAAEMLLKLYNNTANTVFIEFKTTDYPICMNWEQLTDGLLEIPSRQSAEISWFLANGVIEVMSISNRQTKFNY